MSEVASPRARRRSDRALRFEIEASGTHRTRGRHEHELLETFSAPEIVWGIDEDLLMLLSISIAQAWEAVALSMGDRRPTKTCQSIEGCRATPPPFPGSRTTAAWGERQP
jgi:hypothetical protein